MITVAGEALIDIIVDPAGNVTSVVGGAPLNTARTIARLGLPVSFLGGVSVDAFGGRIMRLLESDGVHYALGQRVEEPTTLAIAELDAHGAASYRFLLDGTSAGAVTPELAMAHVADDCQVLHVGTLGLVLQPLAEAMRAVVAASPSERVVMIDPNCRPAVMGPTSDFRDTLAAVLPRADVVKVSGDDLQFLYPALTPDAAARLIQAESGAVVLFTDGARAVRLLVGEEEIVLDVPTVPVVDTVGAGDSFSGGFLAAWARGGHSRADLRDAGLVVDAARFGITVAALTCQRAGAEPPRIREIEVS